MTGRWRLDIAYDGSNFHGWARQPRLRTVQGCLEDALGTVLRTDEVPALTCAGRTDAGVHARGQVAHVDLPEDRGADVATRLTGLLDDDVAVLGMVPAPSGFDARFSALWRRYRYRVCDRPAAWDPLMRRHVVRHRRELDLAAMNEAGAALLGEHDFAALCRPRAGSTTIRRILDLSWERDPHGHAVMEVRADAFCHSMVRALVGALLPVGEGRQPTGWPRSVVDGGRRDPRVRVMPAHGLVLEEVGYPADAELAERQVVTRTIRTHT